MGWGMTIRAKFAVVAALSLAGSWLLAETAQAGERDVTIINKTRYPIVSLRMRGADDHRWSNDLLAEQVNGYVKMTVIEVGTSKRISIPDYSACRCDLFVTFADGHRRHLFTEICKVPTVVIAGS